MKRFAVKGLAFVRAIVAAFVIMATAALVARAEDRFIIVASTTSTADSGLFDWLLPKFEEKTGIDVRVVAKGTGQAIESAKRGDADVLVVHSRAAEEAFVAEGYGVKRYDLMHNDFLIAGPSADPAHIKGMVKASDALGAIAGSQAPFASRGDDSGTHKAEMKLWIAAGVDPSASSGAWYKSLGSGMGATLNTASAMGAYVLSDRATWAAFGNKGDLVELVAGDPALRNDYGIILVNPAKFPHVKAQEGQAFVVWMLSPDGQGAINAFHVEGQQVFFGDAPK
jgi:tungstate transport system substrate-binding protein